MMYRLFPVAALLASLAACTTGNPPPITEAERALLADPPREVLDEVEARLPETLAMVERMDAVALAQGRPLTGAEIETARALGVAHPERVRVHTEARRSAEIFAALMGQGLIGGLTTGYGITIKRGMEADWLVAHELVHVRQFEELGREGMVRRYLTEILVLPDNLIPLEREAIEASEAVVGPNGPYAY